MLIHVLFLCTVMFVTPLTHYHRLSDHGRYCLGGCRFSGFAYRAEKPESVATGQLVVSFIRVGD
jgi:hypothetical protein